ncbi:GGDEF domain-containing protein [Hoeflea alexandrii]|uniref:GGDEF domain-containing protein n=1 Tax=Hoeflea alexandrii TaxID=288436 RepID=UPI0022B002B8|nr:GGDEF domain-containing protein [Hoeflea alexandrii]MCZ4290076.1 GGDEF domain-containing protein [Hoeflea alexandrii]
MRFSAMWNPLSFVGYEIASKTQIEQTVRELYNSRPHVAATLGVGLAGLSAALGGAVWTGIAATLIVLACLIVRLVLERRFVARSPGEMDPKWIRLFVAGSLTSGFGWGLSGAMLLYGTSADTQAITMGVACAIAHGAAGRAYMMPGTAFYNIALMIGLMSIGAYANGNVIYVPAFLLYFTFLASFIVQMVNNRMSQLRAEQMAERLLQELTEKNELLRVANETLATKAYKDPLTGLANRRKFDLALAESLAAAGHNGFTVTLMMIDVDHFKAFNDTYGHQSGDGCLQLISGAISDTLSGRDSLVARYGGEEFVVVLRGEDPAAAIAIAERICLAARLTSLETLPNAPPRQTISIGLVSCRSGTATTREAMLAAADEALYEAKKSGRNRVCVYRGTGWEEGEVLSLDAVKHA